MTNIIKLLLWTRYYSMYFTGIMFFLFLKAICLTVKIIASFHFWRNQGTTFQGPSFPGEWLWAPWRKATEKFTIRICMYVSIEIYLLR